MKQTTKAPQNALQDPTYHTTLTTEAVMAGLGNQDDDAVETMGAMQLLSTAVLAAAARGDLDLNTIASWMLASRGQDATGKWVGFPEAKRQHEMRMRTFTIADANGEPIRVTIPD